MLALELPFSDFCQPAAADLPLRREELDQFFTPVWAARALFRSHFAHLGTEDVVLEPSCGPGRMLRAVPAHIGAVGVELDPALAARARETTGRDVIQATDRRALAGENPPSPPARLDAVPSARRRRVGTGE